MNPFKVYMNYLKRYKNWVKQKEHRPFIVLIVYAVFFSFLILIYPNYIDKNNFIYFIYISTVLLSTPFILITVFNKFLKNNEV